MDSPWPSAIFPIVVLIGCMFIALPPLIINIIFNPFTYVISTAPLVERLKIAQSKFFYYSWRVAGPMFESGVKPHAGPLLQRAYGVVLEIGAGTGINIKNYKRAQIERLILVEPNVDMHPALRAAAAKAGFTDADGSLLLLGCGGAASDAKALAVAGIGPESVDCVISVHVLCGIPRPAEAVELYRKLLKKGGMLAFFEHVRSDQQFTANAQTFYTKYVWPHTMGGCELNRPTGAWIAGGPHAADGAALVNGVEMVNGDGHAQGKVGQRWKSLDISRPKDEPTFTCIPHVQGIAIKA